MKNFYATFTIVSKEYRVWAETSDGKGFFFLSAPNYETAYAYASLACEEKGGRLERFAKGA